MGMFLPSGAEGDCRRDASVLHSRPEPLGPAARFRYSRAGGRSPAARPRRLADTGTAQRIPAGSARSSRPRVPLPRSTTCDLRCGAGRRSATRPTGRRRARGRADAAPMRPSPAPRRFRRRGRPTCRRRIPATRFLKLKAQRTNPAAERPRRPGRTAERRAELSTPHDRRLTRCRPAALAAIPPTAM